MSNPLYSPDELKVLLSFLERVPVTGTQETNNIQILRSKANDALVRQLQDIKPPPAPNKRAPRRKTK